MPASCWMRSSRRCTNVGRFIVTAWFIIAIAGRRADSTGCRNASQTEACDGDQEAGIEPSVGSVGDSYDNALAETINGLYKAEVIHRREPWRSFEAIEYATLKWVDWFNHRRLLEPIGNITPAEAEEQYYAAAENLDMAA